MSRFTLEEINSRVEEMPSLSRIAIDLIKLIDNPRCTRDDVRKLVSLDEVLYVQIFKYANSVAIGGARGSVTSLDRAIDVIGLNELKNVAFTAAARSMFKDKDLWRQSVFLATTSQFFARNLDLSRSIQDDIYIAALLNTFGVLVFKTFYEKDYKQFQSIQDFQERLDKEKEYFGINNLELAYLALRSCGLPETILDMIYSQQFYNSDKFAKHNAIIEVARRLSELRTHSAVDEMKVLSQDENFKAMMDRYELSSILVDKQLLEKLNEQVETLTHS